jgi:hypothetical protein
MDKSPKDGFLELPPDRTIAGMKIDDAIHEKEERIETLVQELELTRTGLASLLRQREEFYRKN